MEGNVQDVMQTEESENSLIADEQLLAGTDRLLDGEDLLVVHERAEQIWRTRMVDQRGEGEDAGADFVVDVGRLQRRAVEDVRVAIDDSHDADDEAAEKFPLHLRLADGNQGRVGVDDPISHRQVLRRRRTLLERVNGFQKARLVVPALQVEVESGEVRLRLIEERLQLLQTSAQRQRFENRFEDHHVVLVVVIQRLVQRAALELVESLRRRVVAGRGAEHR